jgi:hypothetical protein
MAVRNSLRLYPRRQNRQNKFQWKRTRIMEQDTIMTNEEDTKEKQRMDCPLTMVACGYLYS